MQTNILSFVDHTHSLAAKLLDDPLVRDNLVDHWAEMLGGGIVQVNQRRQVAAAVSIAVVSNKKRRAEVLMGQHLSGTVPATACRLPFDKELI